MLLVFSKVPKLKTMYLPGCPEDTSDSLLLLNLFLLPHFSWLTALSPILPPKLKTAQRRIQECTPRKFYFVCLRLGYHTVCWTLGSFNNNTYFFTVLEDRGPGWRSQPVRFLVRTLLLASRRPCPHMAVFSVSVQDRTGRGELALSIGSEPQPYDLI